ncbi:MAG: sigma-54-dependent Fis family transcriptional regulator [bacterium]|nr:sigma-54-dependent Fis family transcriptional regulator [bacterium]
MDAGNKLLQNSGFVKTLMDSLPCGVMVLNEQGRVKMVNHVLTRAFGNTSPMTAGTQKGHILHCIHTFESSAACGLTQDCSHCGIRKLTFSALSENQERRSQSSLEVLINGQLRQLTLMLNAVPFSVAAQRFVLLLFEDLHKLADSAPPTNKPNSFRGIIGKDGKMLELFVTIKQVAPTTASVLIQGESGAGKELVALAIHQESPRADKHFIPVNCSALPESLAETELFGHTKGAFTGATHNKKGRFELAHLGTIFLDEIGELSLAMQAKLLRVLENGEIQPVGSERIRKVDVRVISASNKNLQEEVAAGRFREDLYYRLRVVPIAIPPLRERPEDIPLLCGHFLALLAKESGRQSPALSSEALSLLTSHPWPGNVRELQNVLQCSLIKAQSELIEPEHLPIICLQLPLPVRQEAKLREENVASALQRAKGNKRRAAEILGVSRSTLYRFFEKQKKALKIK